MSWSAVIIAGGAILGGGIASRGARSAAGKQKKASQRAIDEQIEARHQLRADLRPFRELGTGVSGTLLDFVLEGPETELERTRGFENIQRSAAAGGKLQSGGTLEELTEFNNLLNARNRSSRFNELFNLATLGANAASGQATGTLSTANNISSLRVGQGDAAAAARVAAANAQGQTISDLGQLFGTLLANRGG